MEQTKRTYHKEYTCIPQIVERERKSSFKKYILFKMLGVIDIILFVFSLLCFRLWTTILFGLLFIPVLFYKKQWCKSPFLAIDSKYIQYIGKMIPWHSLKHIMITYETNINKKIPYNYMILFKNKNGKTITIDTYYFEPQEEIVESIKQLAYEKDIHVTTYKREHCLLIRNS